MRAQEWIPSGPLHILLYEAFGWEPPIYCHLPMVMGKDGQKLSKRHGSTSVRDFRAKGYLPEAIINYVTLVGWSLDDHTEFFTKEDLEKCFRMENIHKAPGVFDYKKLDWFNGQYIRQTDDEKLAALVTPYLQESGFISKEESEEEKKLVLSLIPSVKERMKVLSDVVPLTSFLFQDVPVTDKAVYVAKGSNEENTLQALEEGSQILLSSLKEGKAESEIEEALVALSQKLGIKINGVFQPTRVAITNSTVSLPLFDSIRLLGLEETEKRLGRAISFFKEN